MVEINEVREIISKLIEKCKGQRNTIALHEQTIDELTKKGQDLESQLQSQSQISDTLRSEYEKLQLEYSDIVKTKDEEILNLKDEISKRDSQIESLTKQIESLTQPKPQRVVKREPPKEDVELQKMMDEAKMLLQN